MGGFKITDEFEINEDHLNWLKDMTNRYELEDHNKALRVVLDYVMTEKVDLDQVFREVRCKRCG